jgi:general stress protein YciG
VSRNREHMAAIGRAGGQARGRSRATKEQYGETAASPAE